MISNKRRTSSGQEINQGVADSMNIDNSQSTSRQNSPLAATLFNNTAQTSSTIQQQSEPPTSNVGARKKRRMIITQQCGKGNFQIRQAHFYSIDSDSDEAIVEEMEKLKEMAWTKPWTNTCPMCEQITSFPTEKELKEHVLCHIY